jgi:hypothetical protein
MKLPMTFEDFAIDARPGETLRIDLRGQAPESWSCVDCGVDTAPGFLARADLELAFYAAYAVQGMAGVVEQTVGDRSEVYVVRNAVWKRAGMKPLNGCLCVGCIERRLGRRLKPKDFVRGEPFNQLPGTARLMKRMGH